MIIKYWVKQKLWSSNIEITKNCDHQILISSNILIVKYCQDCCRLLCCCKLLVTRWWWQNKQNSSSAMQCHTRHITGVSYFIYYTPSTGNWRSSYGSSEDPHEGWNSWHPSPPLTLNILPPPRLCQITLHDISCDETRMGDQNDISPSTFAKFIPLLIWSTAT